LHLTNVDEREEWRRFSVFEGLGGMRVAGKGFDGYQAALAWLGEQRS
jgi:3-dehydroquinate dehydratase